MKRCVSRSRRRNSLRALSRRARVPSEWVRNALIVCHNSGTPRPVVASVFTIGGRHSPSPKCCSARFDSIDVTMRSAPSRSHLFTTKMSAISMMPAFSACTSSPVPGTRTTTEMSAVRTMSTSSWPTPTVSMITRLLPAASSTSAASLVARARPPMWPRVAMLRMNTSGSCACACMRSAIAEDRAARERAGRIDRDHADGFGRLAGLRGQPVDQRALAGARRPGDADQIGATGVRKDVAHERAPRCRPRLRSARWRGPSPARRRRARARPKRESSVPNQCLIVPGRRPAAAAQSRAAAPRSCLRRWSAA